MKTKNKISFLLMALSTIGSAVQAMKSTNVQSSQQFDTLIQDLNKHGRRVTQKCINDPGTQKALQEAFCQRESTQVSTDTPFLSPSLMQPILKDSSVSQSPLSLEEFIVTATNCMQKQQPSSPSENASNNLANPKQNLACNMQILLESQPTYSPSSSYIRWFHTEGVDDKQLLSIVDKMYQCQKDSTFWTMKPIVWDEDTETWLSATQTSCHHTESVINKKQLLFNISQELLEEAKKENQDPTIINIRSHLRDEAEADLEDTKQTLKNTRCENEYCRQVSDLKDKLNGLPFPDISWGQIQEIKASMAEAMDKGLLEEDFDRVKTIRDTLNTSQSQQWPITQEDWDYIEQCSQFDASGEAFWKSTYPLLNLFTRQQGKVMPILMFVPCDKGTLGLYDLTRCQLVDVHLVGLSDNPSPRWHTDDVKEWSPTGFAMHDMGHAVGTSSIIDPIVQKALIDVLNTAQEKKDKETIGTMFFGTHENNYQGLAGNTANTDYFWGQVYQSLAKDLENGGTVDMNKERIGPLGHTYTLQDLLNQEIVLPLLSVSQARVDEFKKCIDYNSTDYYLDDLCQGAKADDMLARVRTKIKLYPADSKSYARSIFEPVFQGKVVIDDGSELENIMHYIHGEGWNEQSNLQQIKKYTATLLDKVIDQIDQIDQVRYIKPSYTDSDTVIS